jgi:hypothetical protein
MAKNEDLVTVDLEQFKPETAVHDFDIEPFLFQGLILREKDFREKLADMDFKQFKGKVLAVHCSADAIVAPWAWMLVAKHAQGYCEVRFGSPQKVYADLFLEGMAKHDWSKYHGKRILVKGCSTDSVPPDAYLQVASILAAKVRALNYGEACSFVPVLKNSRQAIEQT